MTENTATNTSEWQFLGEYEADCGQADCTFGQYSVPVKRGITTITPGCATCEVAVSLIDVFNPDDEHYVAGVPECFKRAAALVLRASGAVESLAEAGHTETARIISEYTAE